MGGAKLWLVFSILILLIVIGLIAILIASKNKKKHKPDYYTFFIVGLIWAVFGLIPRNGFFFILGLAFMALGLAHKDEWKKNRKFWKKLPKKQRIIMQVLIAAGIIILIILVAYTFLLKRGYCFA